MDWKFCQSAGCDRSTALGRAVVGSASEQEEICAGDEAHCGYQNEPSGYREAAPPILQVNSNEAAMMNLALNNASNVVQYYKDLGEKVSIEVVTFGPGLHMLRDDTSPAKARIEALALSSPEISFKACGNTRENMSKVEGKEIPLISEAKVVKSGVVRVMELQEQGWTYVKP